MANQQNAEAGFAGAQCSANGVSPESTLTVNCDLECWVQARIRTAVRMALAVKSERFVRADDDILECALDGIVNGAAVEIIHTLGMEPEWVNLRKPPVVSSNVYGPGEPMTKPSSPNARTEPRRESDL